MSFSNTPRSAPELPRINHRIRAREVRVVLDGTSLGVLAIRDALRAAEERGLDLVEVDSRASPPVCKIVDRGRFAYEAKKKRAPKSKATRAKELTLRPKTDSHDRETKTRAARRFLEEGHALQLTVRFRGREIVHADRGRAQLVAIASALEDVGRVVQAPLVVGRTMTMRLVPLRTCDSPAA
jgi:translation initiation factor IF-3